MFLNLSIFVLAFHLSELFDQRNVKVSLRLSVICIDALIQYILCSALGITTVLVDRDHVNFSDKNVAGILVQYPDTTGSVYDLKSISDMAHANGVS